MTNSPAVHEVPDQNPSAGNKESIKKIIAHCHQYKASSWKSAWFQLTTTLAAFFGLAALIFASFYHEYYALTALLILPAGGLLVRIFVIQHDCGHGSFFPSRRANEWTGILLSVLTFTPYDLWRKTHNMHHAGSGNLDRRGSGSIDTLTVGEYMALSPFKRFAYRVYRHPLVLLVFGPPVYVLICQRFPAPEAYPFIRDYHSLPSADGWKSVMGLNIYLAVFYSALGFFLGWTPMLVLCLSMIIVAYWAGQWLFYVQHQFEDSHWETGEKWNYSEAALQGSSFYALPKVLQWFTGNIGFHHIHHLCASIPNYRLQACHEASEELRKTPKLTLRQSLKCVDLALWDEKKSKMIRFRDLRAPVTA